MQTLSNSSFKNSFNNKSPKSNQSFSAVGRELTSGELEEVSGGSYSTSVGTAVSLVIAGAALAGSAPLIAGVLILGSIGASGVAIFSSWNNLDEKS